MSVKTVSQSPTPTTTLVAVVDFPAAIAAVRDGKRITKQEWADPDSYGMLKDDFLMIKRGGTWFKWEVKSGDLTGADWIVME